MPLLSSYLVLYEVKANEKKWKNIMKWSIHMMLGLYSSQFLFVPVRDNYDILC